MSCLLSVPLGLKECGKKLRIKECWKKEKLIAPRLSYFQ